MLTVCGGLMAIVSSYSMLVSANEIYIPGFAILATAGGLAILVDMLHRHCRNI